MAKRRKRDSDASPKTQNSVQPGPQITPGSAPAEAPEGLRPVPVTFEFTDNLPALLESLQLSLVLTTYQAGRVVTIGCREDQLQVGFSHFPQAMGLTRTPQGLALVSRDTVWSLPANREIAAVIEPEQGHDIAFLARSAHHTGPVMGHDLAWGRDGLWLVNTLFNCLARLEAPWSFVPRWRPPFITALAAGDRCHLNGLALAEDGNGPAWVTALGECDVESGWRETKVSSGCLIEVPTGRVVTRGLCMPHSPRLYRGQLLLLDSGHGALLRVDPESGSTTTIATLPGFTRGLDCHAGHAFVGLSRIRESSVFGGLPLQDKADQLKCGLAVVDLADGTLRGLFWFHSGVEEVYDLAVLPGWRNPVVVGPDSRTDGSPSVWLVPPE